MTTEDKSLVLELLCVIHGGYGFLDKWTFQQSVQEAIKLLKQNELNKNKPDETNRTSS